MVKVGRPRSHGYEEFGFSLVKQRNKFVAICLICKRTLQNTAFTRLKGHRNICKPDSAGNIPEPQCSLFVPGDDTFGVPSQNDFLFPDGISQLSSDGFMQSQNMIQPDSGMIGDDGRNRNFSSYYNADYIPHLPDKKHETDLKKVALLEVIKKYKNILFEDPKADKKEVWKIVLKKARSLGLASEDNHWTFVRDSLYGMWKNRTLAKKDYLESDGWNDKLDIVDLAILKILDIKPPVSSTIDLLELNSDCSLEGCKRKPEVHGSIPSQGGKCTLSSVEDDARISISQKRKEISTQTTDELHEAELKIKKLKCELLEIEVYKQRLQVLQLERQLKLPPSACTANLFRSVLVTPTVNIVEIDGQKRVTPTENNAESKEQGTAAIKSELVD